MHAPNRIVRLVYSYSSDVLLELGRSFCGSFYCSYLCGQVTKHHHFLKFVWHTTTSIVKILMFEVAAVPVQCL